MGPAPWTSHANYTTVDEIPIGEEVLCGYVLPQQTSYNHTISFWSITWLYELHLC
jgi:hypothetical protein